LAIDACEELAAAHGEECDCDLCVDMGGMHYTLSTFCFTLESQTEVVNKFLAQCRLLSHVRQPVHA
jgi:hypothetical protein